MAGVPPPNAPHISAQPMIQQPQPAIPPFPMAGMRAPLMAVPPPGMPMMIPPVPPPLGIPGMPATLSAPPMPSPMGLIQPPPYSNTAKPYTKPVSVADMKANTTVFVGNITDKANDSLVRQILLRCGYIVGWKRVQNASGKLQAFGFCEYADPECTLRAMRILNAFKLGDKSLVVKVDSKNKKELLKYLAKKKKLKTEENIDEEEIDKEVEELLQREDANPFEQELDDEIKEEDKKILTSINTLVKENISVLSGEKTTEDIRRENDVNESLLAMAIQSGRVDEDTTLEGVDMEDDMKTLVSDEIKKFRQSYQDYEENKVEQRRKRKSELKKEEEPAVPITSRSRSPVSRRPRSRSPRKRSRSPRTRSQERRDRMKEREQRKKEEREKMLKEEEEYEQRQLERKKRDREKAYMKALEQWESRERRKVKDRRFIEEEETDRLEKMEREKKCLAEFLEDYDDEKDDHRFYKGSVYNHRRNERDIEIEEDYKDRKREKEELETLRLEVMERQLREIEEEKKRKQEEEEAKGGWTDSSVSNLIRCKNEDDEEEVVAIKPPDIDESLPLTKSGYQMGSGGFVPIQVSMTKSGYQMGSGGFVPIQVQPAPAVSAPGIKPEIKSNPNEETSMVPYGPPPQENGAGKSESPQQSSKLFFELKSSSTSKVSNIEGVFTHEEDKEEAKPKKKLYTLTSSSKGSHFTAAMAELPHGGVVTPDDKKKLIQSLVSSIPSKKEELFHWDLRWNQIDQSLMERRIAPWINKKIVEYIGEPEPTLTEFISNKLAEHVSAEDILKDITMVLDDEAEVFVLKLWRLLIYETEARHLGIAKNY